MRPRKENKKSPTGRILRRAPETGVRRKDDDATGEGAASELVEDAEGREVRLREQDTQRDNIGTTADPGLPNPRRRAKESESP